MLQTLRSDNELALKAKRTLALLKYHLVGLAQDFWKDGNWSKSPSAPFMAAKPRSEPAFGAEETGAILSAEPQAGRALWHAEPGEISEKMWGPGCLTPGDDHITELLLKPLNLTKGMTVIDLAAGLGARMRRASEEYGAQTTGREPDPEIAMRAKALAAERKTKDVIVAYDPMSFTDSGQYDCILARETFYRVADRKKFIDAIAACSKAGTQVSFTDYIVNPESQQQPAILAWKAFEQDADPPGLVELAELWAKAGISLRVHDDRTEYYKKEVKEGLLRLAKYLASDARPDKATKKAIEKRIKIWAHRSAAMEEGLKFYRFYGQK
ncbi:MAG: methyltransferase domain-containing protein [Alphaproteobacteria bacterium]|nr:methyltransferase domain-containing protein [Alphaproteobacteria bacterium]